MVNDDYELKINLNCIIHNNRWKLWLKWVLIKIFMMKLKVVYINNNKN